MNTRTSDVVAKANVLRLQAKHAVARARAVRAQTQRLLLQVGNIPATSNIPATTFDFEKAIRELDEATRELEQIADRLLEAIRASDGG